MVPLGWERDKKKFRSHLTLGRVKETFGLGKLVKFAKNYKFDPIPITFDRITLFQSTLTQQGPIYKIIYQVKLAEKFE